MSQYTRQIYVHGMGHLAAITKAFLIQRGYAISRAPEGATLVWACEDVDDNAEQVIESIVQLLRHDGVRPAIVLVSSQLPVGSIKRMEDVTVSDIRFACCPENFKMTDGPEAYLSQARFVLGTRPETDVPVRILLALLFDFAKEIVWMSVESAEMTKHAINAYLGMCIAFANEVADVCKVVGADVREVEAGLRSEPRVSKLAPLKSGEAFGGGHIDRDLTYLRNIKATWLIGSIQASNNDHEDRQA